jgi:hypothetical protein
VSVTSGCATLNPVGVSIAASANNVNAGTLVSFVAIPVNGGVAPAFQWRVNGSNAGSNSSTYEYVPENNDVITCVLTSNAMCISGNPAVSNEVVMVVNSLPVSYPLQNMLISGNDCFDALQTILVAGSGTFFTVQPGGDATMIAGENIFYYPGTLVEAGGHMYGYIAPSGPWCSDPSKPVTGTTEVATTLQGEPLFRIYPNPTTGEFNIEMLTGGQELPLIVEIYTMQGSRKQSFTLSSKQTYRFTLAGEPAGIYMVRVSNGESFRTARIVKLP